MLTPPPALMSQMTKAFMDNMLKHPRITEAHIVDNAKSTFGVTILMAPYTLKKTII